MVRFKNRYILFEILWDEGPTYFLRDFNASSMQQTLKASLELYYGDMGVAALAHSMTGKPCDITIYSVLTFNFLTSEIF